MFLQINDTAGEGDYFVIFVQKEGRKVSKIFESVSGIDKELLKECKTQYPA